MAKPLNYGGIVITRGFANWQFSKGAPVRISNEQYQKNNLIYSSGNFWQKEQKKPAKKNKANKINLATAEPRDLLAASNVSQTGVPQNGYTSCRARQRARSIKQVRNNTQSTSMKVPPNFARQRKTLTSQYTTPQHTSTNSMSPNWTQEFSHFPAVPNYSTGGLAFLFDIPKNICQKIFRVFSKNISPNISKDTSKNIARRQVKLSRAGTWPNQFSRSFLHQTKPFRPLRAWQQHQLEGHPTLERQSHSNLSSSNSYLQMFSTEPPPVKTHYSYNYHQSDHNKVGQPNKNYQQSAHNQQSENYKPSENFWEILASFSQGLWSLLHLEGWLFLLQLAVFSLILQYTLPPLSRYYFSYSAKVLLQPLDEGLDSLLREDISFTDAQPNTGITLTQVPENEETQAPPIDIASVSPPAIRPNPDTNIQADTQSGQSRTEASQKPQAENILYPAYRSSEYIVKSGENISVIAQRYKLTMSTLISVNQIERAKSLQAGQKIQIPNIDGLLYRVKTGDSLARIARQFDSSIGILIDTNQLQSKQLIAGSQIFIPGASLSRYELRKVFGNLYIYPHFGKLSSKFGYRTDPVRRRREFHNGIDIVGPFGTKVAASSDGSVVSAGYHFIYGNYVILQHGKGIKTLYGHMSQLSVRKGQHVFQGHILGRIGSSGLSTGPHIHFSIFVDGKAVNPLDYLTAP